MTFTVKLHTTEVVKKNLRQVMLRLLLLHLTQLLANPMHQLSMRYVDPMSVRLDINCPALLVYRVQVRYNYKRTYVM